MFETAIAQLRFAASIVLAMPFDLRSLDRLVEGVLDRTRFIFMAINQCQSGGWFLA
jgi:hypothetical protein